METVTIDPKSFRELVLCVARARILLARTVIDKDEVARLLDRAAELIPDKFWPDIQLTTLR
jgi:hypothetical protein